MRATIYNILSVIFFFLTLVSATFTVVRLAGPPPPQEVVVYPTEIILPTLTPTHTHTATIPPTFTYTPSNTPTFTPSATFTSTYTLTPTITPSLTITQTPGPSETPSITPPPSPTETPTGPTPTLPPSPNPYLFDLQQEVFYGTNVYNSLGCAWQGIGGRVLDLNGVDLVGSYQIRVFNNSFDRTVLIGSNTLYGGASGWEIQTDSFITSNTYFVQVESTSQTQLSPRIQVTFTSNCTANLATIIFKQQRAP